MNSPGLHHTRLDPTDRNDQPSPPKSLAVPHAQCPLFSASPPSSSFATRPQCQASTERMLVPQETFPTIRKLTPAIRRHHGQRHSLQQDRLSASSGLHPPEKQFPRQHHTHHCRERRKALPPQSASERTSCSPRQFCRRLSAVSPQQAQGRQCACTAARRDKCRHLATRPCRPQPTSCNSHHFHAPRTRHCRPQKLPVSRLRLDNPCRAQPTSDLTTPAVPPKSSKATSPSAARRSYHHLSFPQHFLNFLPLPQGHGSLRPKFLNIFSFSAFAARSSHASITAPTSSQSFFVSSSSVGPLRNAARSAGS